MLSGFSEDTVLYIRNTIPFQINPLVERVPNVPYHVLLSFITGMIELLNSNIEGVKIKRTHNAFRELSFETF